MSHQSRYRREDRFGQLTPELAAALVTLIVALVAYFRPRSPLPSLVGTVDLTIAGAVTVLVAAIVGSLLRRRSAVVKFSISLTVTLVALYGTASALVWVQTKPGRDARQDAMAWSPVSLPRLHQMGRVRAGKTRYGTGYADIKKGEVDVHVDSRISNFIGYFPTNRMGKHFYAEVTAVRVEGSSVATACVLAFGYRSRDSFYQIAWRFDGVQLARFEGTIPARVFTGPIAVPYASNLDEPHRLAVLRNDHEVTVFVDDHKVFVRDLPRFDGGVTFGTLDIGTGYRDDAQCNFSNFVIRKQQRLQ